MSNSNKVLVKANSSSRRGKPNPRLAQSPDGLKEAMHLVEFHYVVSEVCYAALEIMRCIKWELKKGFIMPIKGNRYRVALSLEDKKWGDYEREATLKLDAGEIREVYVEQAEFSLVIPVNGGNSRMTNRRRGCPVVLVQQRRNGRFRAPNHYTRKTVESVGVSQVLREHNASLVNCPTKTARTDQGPVGVNLTKLI